MEVKVDKKEIEITCGDYLITGDLTSVVINGISTDVLDLSFYYTPCEGDTDNWFSYLTGKGFFVTMRNLMDSFVYLYEIAYSLRIPVYIDSDKKRTSAYKWIMKRIAKRTGIDVMAMTVFNF